MEILNISFALVSIYLWVSKKKGAWVNQKSLNIALRDFKYVQCSGIAKVCDTSGKKPKWCPFFLLDIFLAKHWPLEKICVVKANNWNLCGPIGWLNPTVNSTLPVAVEGVGEGGKCPCNFVLPTPPVCSPPPLNFLWNQQKMGIFLYKMVLTKWY